jgi:phenylacetate-coenzyme A ligase PaaK-like adenylate-forming protein
LGNTNNKKDMIFNFIYRLWYSYKFKKKFKWSYFYLSNFLKKSQYWDEAEMLGYQNRQLAELKKNAEASIFYSQNLKKAQLLNLSIDNISSLPSLSKEIIKKNPELIINKFIIDYTSHSTSGSSGDPVKVRVSLNAEAFRLAGRMRYYDWWGIKPYDRNILIWGKSKQNLEINSILKRIKRIFIRRSLHINVFDLSSIDFKTIAKKIKCFKPRFFRGYTSAIEQFADLCIESGTNLLDLKLKGVIVTSEVLFESQRKKIELVFGCPVINEYGAADGGLIAFECPSGSMHVFEEAILINTTPSGGVLLTDLHNYAMPLINFELGDQIILAEENCCECGRSLKIIEQIEGRQGDYIQKSNGERLSQYFFYYLIKDLDTDGFPDNITKFKVCQKDKVFDFYFVKGKDFSKAVIDHIEKRLFSEIGDDIFINFKSVSDIEKEPSGKLRFFTRE